MYDFPDLHGPVIDTTHTGPFKTHKNMYIKFDPVLFNKINTTLIT